MRQPWIQIAMEMFEVSAPELGIELSVSEAEAGWMLMKLIPWALARCPDHMPPSESDVVEGDSAARKIAKAVGWMGDPEEFASACERLRYAPLERLAGGIRIRGLDRYDAGWGSNHRDLWAEWRAFREGNGRRPGSLGVHAVNTKGKHCPDPDADADADKPPPPTPSAVATEAPVNWVVVVDECWKAFGSEREARGRTPEIEPPPGFLAWVKDRHRDGFSPRDCAHSYGSRFIDDPTIKAKDRPAAVWIKNCWSTRMTKAPPAPPRPTPLQIDLGARLDAIREHDGYAAGQLGELEPIAIVGDVLQLRARDKGTDAWVRDHFAGHLRRARLELLAQPEVAQ